VLDGKRLTSNVEYLSGVANESPIFTPAYTPVYSNEAFAIIGQILSNLAGQSVEELFNDRLVKDVGLKSTYYEVPSSINITNRGVIPGSPEKAGWSTIFGPFSP
jgi:CubicO group peptidase (beta-lactamase class C family)